MKIKITAIVLAALLALAAAGCQKEINDPSSSQGASEKTTANELGDDVAAVLDPYTVSMEDYTAYYRMNQKQLEMQAAMSGYSSDNMGEFWNLDQGTGSIKDMLAEQSLLMAKQLTILCNEAQKKNVKPNPAAEEASEQQLAEALAQLEGDAAAFEANYGVSPDTLRTMNTRSNTAAAFVEDIKKGITLSDADIKAEYDQNPDQYDKVTVRHILVSTNDMTDEEKAAAKEKADNLLKQIQGGTEIGSLVEANTDDPASIPTQGEYTFGKGEMVLPFEEWAFQAKDGDQSIVETDYGYHVMEMIGRPSYEELQEQIKETMLTLKSNETIDKLFQVIDSSDWVINQKMIDTVVVAEAADTGSTAAEDEIPKETSASESASAAESSTASDAEESAEESK